MQHTILISAVLGLFACIALLVSAILRRRSVREEVATQIKDYTTRDGQRDAGEPAGTPPVRLPEVSQQREQIHEQIKEAADAMPDTPTGDELRAAALRAERARRAALEALDE